MSRRLQISLALLGIILILLALAALAYALWPAVSGSERIPLPADLFSQPGAAVASWRVFM